jgi:hypothetical protein
MKAKYLLIETFCHEQSDLMWPPLEHIVGEERCGDYMYMCCHKCVGEFTGRTIFIYQYKHTVTREIINVSASGRNFTYYVDDLTSNGVFEENSMRGLIDSLIRGALAVQAVDLETKERA